MTHSHYSPLRLAALGLSAMLIPLGSTMIAVALPDIGVEFNQAPGLLTQWLVNSYLLIGIAAQSPAGKLGDFWGYKNTLRLGQMIFGMGSLLAVLFPFFGMVVASRLLTALGGAFMVPTVIAVYRIVVPPEKRHRVFGYFGAMMGFAAALGPSLGGVLVHHFGWKSIFLMNLPPLLFSIFLSWNFFREDLHEKPQNRFSFDWPGTLFMAGGLLLLVTGLKGRAELLVPAALLLWLFIWWEGKTPHPMMNLNLFSRRSFSAGCALVALQNLGMYALLFQLPYLLKLLYQWGPEHSGPFMTSFMVSMMAASALGGRVAEKLGVKTTCVMGSLLSVAGMSSLSFLTPGEDWRKLIVGLILGGVGLGLANGPSQSAAMGSIEKNHSGIASGILSTSRYLGGVVGISILGLLFASPESTASLGQYHLAILAFAGSFAIAAGVSFLLPGRLEQPRQ